MTSNFIATFPGGTVGFSCPGGVFSGVGSPVGFAVGSVYPLVGSEFKDLAQKGNNQNFWVGYSFDDNWAVELGLDRFNFDQVQTKHQAVTLSGVYRSTNQVFFVHPIAKLGVGTVETIQTSLPQDLRSNSFEGKLGLGIETDFKYVSVGGLVNYYFISNAGDPNYLKNVGAVAPVFFITFHDSMESAKSATPSK